MLLELHREAKARLIVADTGGNRVDAHATPLLSVIAPGGTITPTVSNADIGVYDATIPPASGFGTYVLNWSYAVTGSPDWPRVKTVRGFVVARRVVPLEELRDEEELASLDDGDLIRLSDLVEDWLRDALRFTPVDRAFDRTFTLRRNTMELRIPGVAFPQSVTGVWVNDAPLSAEELADITITDYTLQRGATSWGFLTGAGCEWPWRRGTKIRVTGVAGGRPDWEGEVPGDLVRAGKTLARYAQRANNYPERARAVVTQNAQITFAMPGPDRPTGLPEVDTTVVRLRLPSVV